MNKVISGYFDDAHRGLQRQQSDPSGRWPAGTASHVQLPPLRSDSVSPSTTGGLMKEGSGQLRHSQSAGGLYDFTQDQLVMGVQNEKYQQTLVENSKLQRKLRAMQDQLSIVTAKKEAFRAQAQRLEKEFKKGREQSDTLQKELLESKREAGILSKESQEAIGMMTEMRKAHIQEVRLLQRGLAQRSGGEQSRNRVNEVADLVDKVGRAVVQRDEATRDKLNLQRQLNKSTADLRSVTDESARLRRQNAKLQESLKEAQRRGKYVVPRPERDPPLDPDDSDLEFESELATFEKRFEILEEGPAGLDILASNLSRDKHNLEKRVKVQQETIASLNNMIESWKTVAAGKDQQIEDLNQRIDKTLKEQAMLQEQIAQKRREIELQVEEEKAELHRRISELEQERDSALSAADSMEMVGSRLSKELVKVHQQYSGPKPKEPDPPPAQPVEESKEPKKDEAKEEKKVLSKQSQQAKTGEFLSLELTGYRDIVELHAKEEASGIEGRMQLDKALLKELDESDPWTDLFTRVGVSLGPPRRIVISSLLGQRRVKLRPSGTDFILTICRFDAQRYYMSGVSMMTQSFADCAVLEDSVTSSLQKRIGACRGNDDLFDLLVTGLSFEADAGRLSFDATAACS